MAAVRRITIYCRAVAFMLGAAGLHAATDGAALFEQYCIPCHGPDGRARTPAARKLGAKDLTASRLPDAEIAHQIAEGKKDAGGKDRMPAFKPALGDPQIAALVEFVKSLRK
jgi:mono/diheme cytochrome c family protein